MGNEGWQDDKENEKIERESESVRKMSKKRREMQKIMTKRKWK